MRAIIQRVNFSSVEVDGKIVGKIDKGILIFIGISKNYNQDKLDWMVDKILKLRLWASDKKGFDLSVRDISGQILVISQFTLFGDMSKGTKPNFDKAQDYELAEKIYTEFIEKLKESGLKVEQGIFGAKMKVNIENDGPVTLLIEK